MDYNLFGFKDQDELLEAFEDDTGICLEDYLDEDEIDNVLDAFHKTVSAMLNEDVLVVKLKKELELGLLNAYYQTEEFLCQVKAVDDGDDESAYKAFYEGRENVYELVNNIAHGVNIAQVEEIMELLKNWTIKYNNMVSEYVHEIGGLFENTNDLYFDFGDDEFEEIDPADN